MVTPENPTGFKFENCLLKHYVRRQGWLPACKERLESIRATPKNIERPRLKYFTFCAPGAVDVVMLDLEKVIRPSKKGAFDSVYYFAMNDTQVALTRDSIPGAIGFPGDFVETVLASDPLEDELTDTIETLEPPANEEYTGENRKYTQLLAIRRQFIKAFPFDVVNLDLERYLFIPRETLPGKLVNAFRKVFAWQRKHAKTNNGKTYGIDGFELMFTVRIGPHEIGDDYKKMMANYVIENLKKNKKLKDVFKQKYNTTDVDAFAESDFHSFFKLAVPKTLMSILREEDWHLDSSKGIKIFEFERPTKEKPYTMLHLVMTVKRNSPPRESRAPGAEPKTSLDAYHEGVTSIFTNDAIQVSKELAAFGEQKINQHLQSIFKHRATIGQK